MSDRGIANSDLWGAFINWMYTSNSIAVKTDFHDRCAQINAMLDNDITGIINTLLEYSINSASEAKLKIECSNETLENLLSMWLQKININIDGVPTGLQELAREYYQERWRGSSLCLLKVSDWKTITVENSSIKVPHTLWFYNGSSVYIKRPSETNYKLGTEQYYRDAGEKYLIKKEDEQIIIQKCGARWITKYPSSYCVRKGILKNYLALEVLQSKGDEAIAKALPYILQLLKGSENQFIKGLKLTPEQLKTLSDIVKTGLKRYKNEKGEVPLFTTPHDEEFKHIIPDLLPILKEELFRQGYRAVLGGLGFVDLLEIAQSRQETRLNPKPFIAEINDGIEGFKNVLKEVIYLIIRENKEIHTKFFNDNTSLKIVNSPIRINIEQIIDQLRSAYVYGAITVETYQEILNIDPDKELERMKKEWADGLRDYYYPHLIQNSEKDPDNVSLPPTTKKQNEKQNEKDKQPEDMQKASDKLMVRCKKCGNEFDLLSIAESGMGYVKCPKCTEAVTQEDAINQEELEIAPYKNIEELLKKHPGMKKYPKGALEVFIKVFNENLPKGEDYAFPVAWTALKRWMKKHGYKKVGKDWVKSEEDK
jgi:phage FluMu protein Com